MTFDTSDASVTEYDVAEAIVRKQLEIKRLTDQVNDLKTYFRQGTTKTLEREGRPTLEVKVTSNTRIDDKLAQDNLSDEDYALVSKRVVDTAKARKMLTAEGLELITKTFEPKIEVKLA